MCNRSAVAHRRWCAATISDAGKTYVVDDGCAESAFGLGAVEGDDCGGEEFDSRWEEIKQPALVSGLRN
ncbi:hypothetical protein IGI04_026988 [Brassica rapa subsp. trilocularis]|uniref:Uncharacterized protein n=1 Tax=Brassica rapa subsp. trilocularis TaxID=1813537 RepID=A0ABQ7L1J0_BRACM|nr:hypothetical protein IGI04_026988 [Brassica rapa subsp. trilocularis]